MLIDSNGNRIYIRLIYIYCPNRLTYIPTKNFEIHSTVCFPMFKKHMDVLLYSFINENIQILIQKNKDETFKINFIPSYRSSKQANSYFEIMENIIDRENVFINEIFKNNRKSFLFYFNQAFLVVTEKNSFDYTLEFFGSNQEKNLEGLQSFLKKRNANFKEAFLEYFFFQNYESYDEEIKKFFWILGFQIGNTIFFELIQILAKTIGNIYYQNLLVLSNEALKILIDKLEKINEKKELIRSSIKNVNYIIKF